MNDNINPTYYQKGIETTDYIVSHSMDYLSGNCIKYMTRHAYKNGEEDVCKNIWYSAKVLQKNYKNEHAYEILMKALDEIQQENNNE